jgi:para-nitrobenzyl esterase
MNLRKAVYAVSCLHLWGCTPAAQDPTLVGPSAPPTCASEVALGPGTVMTAQGPVQGSQSGSSYAYLGIPYAAPPVGERRWRPPLEPECHPELRAATTFGEICPQLAMGKVVGDEDCLTLNVWAPVSPPAQPLPVLVWVHGGGNHSGLSWRSGIAGGFENDGRTFVDRGLIFVSFNYRIGALGFLAHPALDTESEDGTSGNYGLMDQIQALTWIQQNIAAFGGDPKQVTVMGSSVGATDMAALMASPAGAGLFQRAILQSLVEGGQLPTLTQYEQGTGARVVEALGCAQDDDVGACLRQRSTAEIVNALPGKLDVFPRIYTPIVDGRLLTAAPIDVIASGEHAHVAILMGGNASETAQQSGSLGEVGDEGSYRVALAKVFAGKQEQVFSKYPPGAYGGAKAALVAATTDALHLCPTRRFLRTIAAAQHEPVYRYLYTHRFENDPMLAAFGASHVFELPFVFHFTGAVYQPSEAELALSDAMVGYWTSFARSGDPNQDGRVDWPTLGGEDDRYLELDTTIEAKAGLHGDLCDFWDRSL